MGVLGCLDVQVSCLRKAVSHEQESSFLHFYDG